MLNEDNLRKRKMKLSHFFFVLLSLHINFHLCHAATEDSAVRALVYLDIQASSFDKCIRVMNGTRQIGCQGALNGNVGVLFHINKTVDIDKIATGQHNPYIVVMHANVLSNNALKRLKDTQKIAGIIVYSQSGYTGKSDGWSPAAKCPRYIYGLYNSHYGPEYSKCDNPWNAVGNGLSDEDVGFPIFLMRNQTATDIILACHDKHNLDQQYPMCAAQMNSFMDGAVSTETCIRRNNLQNNLSPATYCQVMGGYTLLASLQTEIPAKPIILITAALDSRSFMLASDVPGANSATGFITLLAVAQALGNLTLAEKNEMKHSVMFLLFDGEAFDNMGSARMVYDMSRNAFPLGVEQGRLRPETFNLSNVSYVIEIGQVGLVNDEAWMHYDPISAKNADIHIKNITDALEKQSIGSTVKFLKQSGNLSLAPSSLQSLLKKRNVSGVLITDFDRSYQNKYYFSAYDTPDKLGVQHNNSMSEDEAIQQLLPLAGKMADVASTISKAVYSLATEQNATSLPVDTAQIAKTLYCYYYNDTCSLFLQLVDSRISTYKSYNTSPSRYVTVFSWNQMKISSYMARSLLVWYTGDILSNITAVDECKSARDNDDVYNYFVFKRNGSNSCYKAAVYTLDGRPPSAVISNYDYGNGPYPAWSESQWDRDAFRLSVFLVQDSVSQGMILFSGLLIVLLSIVIVWTVTKKSDILFNSGDIL